MWLINSRKYSSTLKTSFTKIWQHPPHLRTCLSMLDKAPTSYWLFFWGFLPSPGVATSAARQLGTFCQKHPKHNDNRAKHKCWPIWKKTRKPKQDIASDNNWKKQSDKFARNVRFKIWLDRFLWFCQCSGNYCPTRLSLFNLAHWVFVSIIRIVNAMLETSFTSSATVIFWFKQVAKYKNRIDSMQLNWQYSSSGLRLTWSDKWIDSHGLTFSKQSSRALADMKNTYPNGCKIFKVDWKPTLNNAQNKCTGKGQSCLIALGGACFRGFPGPALLVAAARFLPRCIQLPLSVGLINSLTDFCPTIKQLWQFDKQIRFHVNWPLK